MIRSLFLSIFFLSGFGLLALPNPAAVNCSEKGGEYEIRSDKEGNQNGVCVFDANGQKSECGGWAFFRNECEKNTCAKWSSKENKCKKPL